MTTIRLAAHGRGRLAFALWVSLYILVVVLPLGLGLIELDPGRGFWINFSVALGFVGLSMFGLQFLMGARSRIVTQPVGMDIVLSFHRQVAFLATLLVFAHPIILFLFDPAFLGLLDVFTSPLRAKFGVASCVALLVLIGLSVFRQRLRVRYETWQLTHALIAVAVVMLALAHVLLVGYYVREPWEQALWIVLSAAFIALGVWVRIVKPLVRRRRRWIVETVAPDAGGTTTVTIRLDHEHAHGLPGFAFEAGQFAWLQARSSPFAMSYHPFSISSSAERPDRISFTIKAHDGFSREIAGLIEGDPVYLDGPFGAFVLPDEGPLVLIGAGVGVTPLLSMLETIADRGESRPCALWLANRDEASISCGAQIESLRARMPLEVVHVLSKPGPGWTGETGHIDAAFIGAHAATAPAGSSYCICGPDALMDTVEKSLAATGVPADSIHSERFGMV
jgi:predicted ferric reductase